MARTAKTPSDMLIVACKLPQGLVIPLPDGIQLTLNGPHSPFASGGLGLTSVKAGVWAIVEAEYAEAKWLQNQLVYAEASRESAADRAEDLKTEKTGFEPVDPKNLPKGLQAAD